jgi:EmrB/QacA subfamily drug resistance transporter
MHDSGREQQPGRAQRRLILAICCMSLLMVGLDNTIVNVALPSIHRELHASLSGLQWTIDAYTLVIATLLMLSGSMADRFGRRRVFQLGLVLFSSGSLLCAVAPSLGALIAFRAVQAIGGSMLNPVAMGIIRNVFDNPRERAQAIGMWGGVAGLSFALGPIVGGALISVASWRWVFLVNVPVGMLAVLLTALYVPESRAPHARRVDPVGQLLVIATLASLTYAIIEGHDAGWTSFEILGLFGVALVAGVSLVLYELRRSEPLLDVRFFRSAPFSGATLTAVCAFGALGGALFLNTLYLQDVRHLSALHAGLYLLPLAAMGIVFGPVSGRLVGTRGSRPSLAVAGIMITASALMFTRLTDRTGTLYLLLANLLFGIGFGLVNPPITNTAVTGMPAAQAGVAAAVASTSRQVGSTLGVAIVGAIVSGGIVAIGPGFAEASHAAWWVITALGVAVLVLGLTTTTQWAQRTARRTADRTAHDEPLAASSSSA